MFRAVVYSRLVDRVIGKPYTGRWAKKLALARWAKRNAPSIQPENLDAEDYVDLYLEEQNAKVASS
jgi:hypothetical protein